MITNIKKLNPRHDYSEDDCYIIFYHNNKPTSTKEIKAVWFDVNCGEKVEWLLVREYCPNSNKKRYRNIKLENIDRTVKIETINKFEKLNEAMG